MKLTEGNPLGSGMKAGIPTISNEIIGNESGRRKPRWFGDEFVNVHLSGHNSRLCDDSLAIL